MGMIDYYEPDPELACPRCDRVLSDWQGNEAENALFIWKQGVPHPTGQAVDEEVALLEKDLVQFNLPEEFTIYTHCTCSTKFLIEAVGKSVDGTWLQTKLIQPDDIEKVYAYLPRAKRKALRQWLQERVVGI